jgi:hypothetical protein
MTSSVGGRIMSPLSREECIELGVSVPTGPLTAWAAAQLAAAEGRKERLAHRGIQSSYLEEIRVLLGKIAGAQSALGREAALPPAEVIDSQRIREEAFAYWQEAKQIVKVEFGSNPDMLVKFRLGVRTGRLIANLTRELDCIVSLLGEHSAQLGWLGVTETFQRVGEVLIGKLREAQAKLDAVCRALPPLLAEQCFRKGRLYDLTRKLVRIGQLEFLHEPEQAAAFNYSVLRRELLAGSEVRSRKVKSAVR